MDTVHPWHGSLLTNSSCPCPGELEPGHGPQARQRGLIVKTPFAQGALRLQVCAIGRNPSAAAGRGHQGSLWRRGWGMWC